MEIGAGGGVLLGETLQKTKASRKGGVEEVEEKSAGVKNGSLLTVEIFQNGVSETRRKI